MRTLKGFLILLSLLFLAFGLTGCQMRIPPDTVRGSGEVVTQERLLVGVERVNLSTIGDLTVVLGDEEKLVIEAEENLIEYLVSDVRSGTLHISQQEGIEIRPTQPVRYTLTVPTLDGLSVNSLGNIQAPVLKSEDFEIQINSTGNIRLAGLSTERLEVTISSSGDVQIEGGEVQDSFIRISSLGNYLARDLASQTAEVRINSSGDATLRVAQSLKANLTSSGNLYYYGNPTLDVKTSSSGRVSRAGD